MTTPYQENHSNYLNHKTELKEKGSLKNKKQNTCNDSYLHFLSSVQILK